MKKLLLLLAFFHSSDQLRVKKVVTWCLFYIWFQKPHPMFILLCLYIWTFIFNQDKNKITWKNYCAKQLKKEWGVGERKMTPQRYREHLCKRIQMLSLAYPAGASQWYHLDTFIFYFKEINESQSKHLLLFLLVVQCQIVTWL